MNARTEWTTDDFDEMSWHDVHVHALRISESEGEYVGTAELYLDIDYILEWGTRTERGLRFSVAQATLQFHDVFNLKFSLDYACVSAGTRAFSIDGIRREVVTYANGYSSYKWTMDINWPSGFIEFEASGFTQTLVGEVVRESQMSLAQSLRKAWQPV